MIDAQPVSEVDSTLLQPNTDLSTVSELPTPLSAADRQDILRLYEAGATQVELAKKFGRNQSTISRVVSRYVDTTQLARRRLKARAEEMADKIADKGNAGDLRKVLEGLKMPDGERVLDPKPPPHGNENSGNRSQVLVGVKIQL